MFLKVFLIVFISMCLYGMEDSTAVSENDILDLL